MALTDKFVKNATTGAVTVAEGSFVDLALPHTTLADPMANTIRCGLYTGLGWLGRGYKENKSIGF